MGGGAAKGRRALLASFSCCNTQSCLGPHATDRAACAAWILGNLLLQVVGNDILVKQTHTCRLGLLTDTARGHRYTCAADAGWAMMCSRRPSTPSWGPASAWCMGETWCPRCRLPSRERCPRLCLLCCGTRLTLQALVCHALTLDPPVR